MRITLKMAATFIAAAFAGQVHAQGILGTNPDPASSAESKAEKIQHLPGATRVIMSSVTPEESERAIWSRAVPTVHKMQSAANRTPLVRSGQSALRVGGDTAPSAPASIPELARALRNNVDLIYEYVRNNIEYIPTWGIQKGAYGALLDNQGTAFDQAALMVALLRESGYTASFVKGEIRLTPAELQGWINVDATKFCSTAQLLAQAQIPNRLYVATSSACPGTSPAITRAELSHVWVKVLIGGTAYYFDPSYKAHVSKTGINLGTVTGYSPSTYASGATTGATVTADYVQGINRTAVRNNLTTYANNLATYIRTNQPAGSLDTVLGGRTIAPHSGAALRQTALPYHLTTAATTEWTDIPVNYKPTLQVRYQGIDKTFASEDIYGKRLTISYNTSNQPLLSLDGTVVATGTAVAAGTRGSIIIKAVHSAYAHTNANQQFDHSIVAGGTYLIANGWGSSGRGPVDLHRARLEQARASGAAATSEAVLGSTLAVISSSWLAQTGQAAYLSDRMARTNTLAHHQFGIAGYNNGAFVDLPGNYFGISSIDSDSAKEKAVFYSLAMHSSILESTVVHQATGASAVSTVKLVDLAASNNLRIYNATSSNFASVQPNLLACSPYMANLQSEVNLGRRLILPQRCDLGEGSWKGYAYFSTASSATSMSMGSIIGGGLAGGYTSTVQPAQTTTQNTAVNTRSSNTLTPSTGKTYGDPVDMTKGGFLYDHNDITVGVGSFPMSLSFARSYTSSNRTQAGTLGLGWTHNFDSNARVGSDGLQGMGEDSALDAVAAITEKMVSLDLLSDTTYPLAKMVIATLGQRWYGDNLINNTVIVKQGLNGEVFVKLPDGTFNSPQGNSAKLTQNTDGTYKYETVNKAVLAYDTAGNLSTYSHPTGIQAKLTYTGGLLSQVVNSVGRSLTLTYTSGRVSAVSDGSRTVRYGYDTGGNLTSYTNAASAVSTFAYDLPGRMTKFFYPSNPTIAIATNVYDTLDRVKTQTNANGKLYTYYFAGSRSEEVGPLGRSLVSYVDENGKVLKSIDPLNRATVNTYDGQSRVIRTVFPGGNSVEYFYDDAPCAAQNRCTHNVRTIRRLPKAGSILPILTESFTYEPNFNKVETSTDSMLNVTSYSYTAQGNPLTINLPPDVQGNRPGTTYGYTAYPIAGFPDLYLQTSVTEKISPAESAVSTIVYSTAYKYVQTSATKDAGTGKLNLTTFFAYDPVGNLTRVDGPRTDVTDAIDMMYDNERRMIKTTDALGKVTWKYYDPDGRLVRTSAQLATKWLVSCTRYSSLGDVIRSWGPAEQTAPGACPAEAAPVSMTDFAYDDLERNIRTIDYLALADGGNRTSETVFNLDGSVQSIKRGVGSTVAQAYATNTYGANGELLTVKDANNNLTTYEYDDHFRKVKTRYPEKNIANASSTTDVESYGYDNKDQITSQVTRSGQSVSISYDALGRPVRRSYPASTADNVEYAYDLLSRPLTSRFANASFDISSVFDNAGRLTSVTAGGKTLSYLYDRGGNLVRTTWPETTPFYVATEYDELNRPTAIKEMGSVLLATYTYDDLSRRITLTRPNGTSTTYGYSSQGALGSLSHDLAGTTSDNTWTYQRNQAQEITTHSWSNDLYQWKASTNGNISYVPNGLNQIVNAAGSSVAYDLNGNLIGDGLWTYTYDAENRLRTANKTGIAATIAYDPVGRLRQTVVGSTTRNLLYSGTGLVAEYDGSGNLLRRYVHGASSDEPIVQYEGSTTSTKTWFYTDHLGSVIATGDAAGNSTATYTYGPYGEPSGVGASRIRYTGQQWIAELGLYYYKARFYSSALARFLQTDPIGYTDDFNLYAYVGGNPINAIDPTGLAKVRGGSAGNPGFIDNLRNGFFQGVSNASHSRGFPDVTDGTADKGSSGYLIGVGVGHAFVGAASFGGRMPGRTAALPANAPSAPTAPSIIAPHGNSNASQRTQHGYEIIDTRAGIVAKTGISGQPLNQNGSSPRANRQANAWNKEQGNSGRYQAEVKVIFPAGPDARNAAKQWEANNAADLRALGQLDPARHTVP